MTHCGFDGALTVFTFTVLNGFGRGQRRRTLTVFALLGIGNGNETGDGANQQTVGNQTH